MKQLFQKREAVVYAVNIRTFGAPEEIIDTTHYRGGTFQSAIPRLSELVALGVNTIHLLPINAIGETGKLGEAGSLYATSDYHQLNPEFGTVEDAKAFVEVAHALGLLVMVDVPSCASLDMLMTHADLIHFGRDGKPSVPTDWTDIVMFRNGKPLQNYFDGFFELMANTIGVDGFRCDVARARTIAFWKHFIGKYSHLAWLAESYVKEEHSPLKNIPADSPERLLKLGFDAVYGQMHIFCSMSAREYMDYLISCHAMLHRSEELTSVGGKSLIGSFLTHDDPSMMDKGGALIYLLTSALMVTQPYTNPYILDGFTTGYPGEFDIFNYAPRPIGENPQIGEFLKAMLAIRVRYSPVFSEGTFIPIPGETPEGEEDSQIMAFARQHEGRTLLIIANKDVSHPQAATLHIPGMRKEQPLQNIAPSYLSDDEDHSSTLTVEPDRLYVSLCAGDFFLGEIDTPLLGEHLPMYSLS